MNALQDQTAGLASDAIGEMIENSLATYHSYLRVMVPQLSALANEIARKHLIPIRLMDVIMREFSSLEELLDKHLTRQEKWLFPNMRLLCGRTGRSAAQGATGATAADLEEAMEQSVKGDREVLEKIQHVRTCLHDASLAGKGSLVDEFMKGIDELHEDLDHHIRFERDSLFPRARENLPGRRTSSEPEGMRRDRI